MPKVRKPLEFITNDSICCEIGVWMGDFSKQILEKNPKMLYLIDPWLFQSEFPGRWYSGTKAKTQNEMDTIYNNILEEYEKFPNVHIIRKKSDDAFQIISDKFFDWIYIDGNHEYEFVLKDLENSRLKVKNNGYITGDDYTWKNNNGIKTVKKAVDEFVVKYNLDITIYPYGQFVIINKNV